MLSNVWFRKEGKDAILDKELSDKIESANDDEEGVEADAGPGEMARLLLAGHVDQAGQQEHHHQPTGCPTIDKPA